MKRTIFQIGDSNVIFSFFVGSSGSGAKYTDDRFPSNIRPEEQEEKRRQILAAASGAFPYSGKHIPRYIFMLDKFKIFFMIHSIVLLLLR
jgi:peroxiredoxin